MKTYVEMEIEFHAFLTLALDGDDWTASRPALFTLRKDFPVPIGRRLGGPQNPS